MFQYTIACGHPGCRSAARYKVAATWTNGTSQELKTYGLCCDRHRRTMVQQVTERRGRLRPAAEEEVGPIGLFVLGSGPNDAALERVEDRATAGE